MRSDVFLKTAKNTIWIGTGRTGLIKIEDLEHRKFVSFTTREGLASNKVKSILEDAHHNLWIGTHNGISKFNISTNTFINFDKEDGLASKEYNYNSAFKAKDGKIYFGGTEGFDVFNPDSMFFNAKKPMVVLSELKIFNQTIHALKPYNKHVYLEKDISLAKTLTLGHRDYVFSLEFAAMDFISPKKNKYAYRLKGFHNQWTYVNSDKRVATYTNLDAGEYLFQVIACNNDGKWNNEGASLQLIVLPPWWETWWFRSTATLLITFGIAGFYYLRLRSIGERNKFLEDEVKKRTVQLNNINNALQTTNQEILHQQQKIVHQKNELETKKAELEVVNTTKDKFFSIVAHDLKGPVNALTFLTTMLKKEWETYTIDMQREYLNHVDNASHQVKNLVISLLEWARTQTRQSTIEPETILLSKVFKETLDLLSAQASQKNITITCDLCPETTVFADYNMTSAIVRNVISNSIKYTPKEGSITISTKKFNENFIRISIKDTGIGMSEDLLEKLFTLDKGPSRKGTEKETGTGLGLVICHEFAVINKGKIWAESQKNDGSTFHIELPPGIKA